MEPRSVLEKKANNILFSGLHSVHLERMCLIAGSAKFIVKHYSC